MTEHIVERTKQPAKHSGIGIFDSGVGGLTVLAKVQEALPNESIVYVGDTANAPYGGKSHEELLRHGRDIIAFLRRQNVKAVVLACGTTSSTVYEQLVAENPDIPLIDVIRPGVRACVDLTGKNPSMRIGVIATAATIKSGMFAKLLKAERPHASLLVQACPMFAPMVESGVAHGPIAKWAVETYISNWRGNIDALVLGCTHFPMLTDVLSEVLGPVQFINLAASAVASAKEKLAGLIASDANPCVHTYYVTGDPAPFNLIARFLLNKDITSLPIKL